MQALSPTSLAGFPAIRTTGGEASRPLLFFVHGAFSSHEPFGPWMSRLAERGWRSVAAARRGRLDVGPANAAGLRIADYVEDCRRMIAALGEIPVVIGHSLGGLIAQKLAEEGLAKGLVLLAPAPAARLAAQPVALPTYLPMMPKILAGLPVLPGAGGCSTIALNRIPEEKRAAIHRTLTPESGIVYREMIFGTFKVDFARIDCPALVVAGAEDRIVSPAQARWTAEKCRGEYREYAGHAHWLLEEPGHEQIVADVDAWLSRSYVSPRLPASAAA